MEKGRGFPRPAAVSFRSCKCRQLPAIGEGLFAGDARIGAKAGILGDDEHAARNPDDAPLALKLAKHPQLLLAGEQRARIMARKAGHQIWAGELRLPFHKADIGGGGFDGREFGEGGTGLLRGRGTGLFLHLRGFP